LFNRYYQRNKRIKVFEKVVYNRKLKINSTNWQNYKKTILCSGAIPVQRMALRILLFLNELLCPVVAVFIKTDSDMSKFRSQDILTMPW
jgi:hypothetical protein